MWNSVLRGVGGGDILQTHCTYYYYPVKSSCCFEKIGGVFCNQLHHNVGVLFIFKTEETHEATLTRFFPLIHFV